MTTRVRSLLLAGGLLVAGAWGACSAAPTPREPGVAHIPAVSAPVSSFAPVASASARGVASPCGDLLEQNAALIQEKAKDPNYQPSSDVSFAQTCFPTPAGAWGLRLLSWEPIVQGEDPPMEWKGGYELVHFAAGLEVVAAVPAERRELEQLFQLHTGMDYFQVASPTLFDFDGDGEPEIFLANNIKYHEDEGYTRAALFSFKGGKVSLYPAIPFLVEGLSDEDADGRPDLLYYPLADSRESPCSGFGYRWTGPAFLGHSLRDGTFSTTDPAARQFLKKSCPAPPKGKPVDNPEYPPEICARIWGASEKEAVAVLGRICRAPGPKEDACNPPAGVCGDHKDREQSARITPPLTLR